MNRPVRPAAAFRSMASPWYHCPPSPRMGVVGRKTRPMPRASEVLPVLMSPAPWLARQPASSGIARWSMRQVLAFRPLTDSSARCWVRLALIDRAPWSGVSRKPPTPTARERVVLAPRCENTEASTRKLRGQPVALYSLVAGSRSSSGRAEESITRSTYGASGLGAAADGLASCASAAVAAVAARPARAARSHAERVATSARAGRAAPFMVRSADPGFPSGLCPTPACRAPSPDTSPAPRCRCLRGAWQ